MTQLIFYTSEDGDSVVKESFTTQTEGSTAATDHFRGVTKMVGLGSGSKYEVDHARGFSTRCVENPLEPLTIDHVNQFTPTSHQH